MKETYYKQISPEERQRIDMRVEVVKEQLTDAHKDREELVKDYKDAVDAEWEAKRKQEDLRKECRMSVERFNMSSVSAPGRRTIQDCKKLLDEKHNIIQAFDRTTCNPLRKELVTLQRAQFEDNIAQTGLSEEEWRRQQYLNEFGTADISDGRSIIFPDGVVCPIPLWDKTWDFCEGLYAPHVDQFGTIRDVGANALSCFETENIVFNPHTMTLTIPRDYKLSDAQKDVIDQCVDYAKEQNPDARGYIFSVQLSGWSDINMNYRASGLTTEKICQDIEDIERGGIDVKSVCKELKNTSLER